MQEQKQETRSKLCLEMSASRFARERRPFFSDRASPQRNDRIFPDVISIRSPRRRDMDVSAPNTNAGEAAAAATLNGSGTGSLQAYHDQVKKSQDDAVSLSGAAAALNAQVLYRAPPVSEGNAAQQAVTTINAALKRFATSLEFTFDPGTLTRVVKVVDSDTGQTVRQMPSEDAIKAARALEQGKGLLIGQKV
jgi:uncharacterized FlaG/YvyC family protein